MAGTQRNTSATSVNQIDVDEVRRYVDRVRAAPELGDREPTVVARWVGDSRARVTFGATSMHLGGDDELNAMQALLGSLAACDVDLLATCVSVMPPMSRFPDYASYAISAHRSATR